MENMNFFGIFSRRERNIRKLLKQGSLEEAQNNLDAAYESYAQAAEIGSGEAMVAIGKLYAVKGFRMVEENNLLELMQQGIPAFPWNVVTKTVPDMKTALEWYSKAAQLEHPQGCAAAGAMLCEGLGCQLDCGKGLAYLKKALALGVEEVRPVISIYEEAEAKNVSDEQYEAKLQEFVTAVEQGKPERYALYSWLKGGTERQKTRLGRVLITRRNLLDPKFGDFKYLFSPEGIPLLPCCARRGAWSTFVRVDLNAFPSDDVQIAISSDIAIRYLFVDSARLRPEGSAVYRSPAFGWLGEEKEAMVLKIDRQYLPKPEDMDRYVEKYHLQPKEYADDNAAFIVENGEKEYSVEVAAIADGKVEVLYRYTIGGSAEIQRTFEPELIELRPGWDAEQE